MTHLRFLLFSLLFSTTLIAQYGKLDYTFGVNGYVTTSIVTPAGPDSVIIGGKSFATSIFIQADDKIVLFGTAEISGIKKFALTRYQANGLLDSTFGTAGVSYIDYDATKSSRYTLVKFQPDGKIVFGGFAPVGSYNGFSLLRYHSNGLPDSTFGVNGSVTLAVGPFSAAPNALALQPDGKIVLAGYAYTGIYNDFAVARFSQNGTVDSTFNSNGIVISPIGAGEDVANALTIAADGKIIVGGFAYNAANKDFALARYKPDGSVDSTFGTAGKVTTIVGPADDVITKIAIQPDGKILALGTAAISPYNTVVLRYNSNGSTDATYGMSGRITPEVKLDMALQTDGKLVLAGPKSIVRYKLTGEPDSSFAGTGKLVAPAQSGYSDSIAALCIQSTGRMVTAGSSVYNYNTTFALAGYTSAGQPDSTFGKSQITRAQLGYKMTVIPGSPAIVHPTYVYSIGTQPDGKIILGGSVKIANKMNMLLARYNPNGGMDSSFGINGFVKLDLGTPSDEATLIRIQPDGKILVGDTTGISGVSRMILIRLNNNGSIDSTFANNGKLIPYFQWSNQDFMNALLVQGDGKILIFGTTSDGTKYWFGLSRYLPNGIPDPTFGTNGKVATAYANNNFRGGSIAIQSDGKIVAVGNSTTPTGSCVNCGYVTVRYDQNGNLDSSFGNGGYAFMFTNDYHPGSSFARNVAVQSNGKIVVSGHTNDHTGGGLPMHSAKYIRYHANGELDSSLNGNGVVTILNADLFRGDKLFTTNGEILVGGYQYSSVAPTWVKLNRYIENGKPDTTFGSGGAIQALSILTSDPANMYNPYYDITIQDGHNIIVAGTVLTGQDRKVTITRIAGGFLPVDFTASPVGGDTTTLITLTDRSLNNPTAWSWSFVPNNVVYQNGTSANSQNPVVRFAQYDYYTVTLTTASAAGSLSNTKPNFLIVQPGPIIDFSADPLTGNLTTVFRFNDHSLNFPSSWKWTFTPSTVVYQNGTTSTSQDVQVKFTSPGAYTVSLQVSNPSSSDSITKPNYVSVVVGVDEIDAKSAIEVFPNPGQGKFDILFKNMEDPEARLQLVRIDGKVAYDEIVQTNNDFHMNNITPGVYFLKLSGPRTALTRKVVVY